MNINQKTNKIPFYANYKEIHCYPNLKEKPLERLVELIVAMLRLCLDNIEESIITLYLNT